MIGRDAPLSPPRRPTRLLRSMWENGTGFADRLMNRLARLLDSAGHHVRTLGFVLQMLTGWAALTWAAADAVPAAWESVVWKASLGALLLGLCGWQMLGQLFGIGWIALSRDERDR